MPETEKIRGRIHIAMNGLVRAGVITGFRTSFHTGNSPDPPLVTVILPEGGSPDHVRRRVIDVLTDFIIGVDVAVEQARPSAGC